MSKKLRGRLVAALCILVVAVYAIGCGYDGVKAEVAASEALYGGNNSPFVIVDKGTTWIIVYHEDTKVMYVISNSAYSCANFTVMVNADGSPMLYEQDE